MQKDKNNDKKYNEEFSRHLDYAEYFPNKKSDIQKEKGNHKTDKKNK